VRTHYPTAASLHRAWADAGGRAEVIARLEERGIEFTALAEAAGQPDADPFDLLCHLAYSAPLRSRRERADRVRREEAAFFEQYRPEARAVLDALLEKYADFGTAQFGGPERLREAVERLQSLLYAA
jgi:type I restriction enzyme R subunit